MPESTTRLAALRTGQVDFIEVPPPDAIAGLKREGFHIVVRPYPHNWPYSLNLNIEPWNNKLVCIASGLSFLGLGVSPPMPNGG